MKRLFLAVCFFCAMASQAFAVGSWATTTYTDIADANIRIITLTWTADAAAASVPNYAFTATDKAFVKGWNLFMVVTDPGTTAPTALYDITILDQYSVDMMGGELADRSATATEQAIPLIDAVYCGRTLDGGAVTVTVGNNLVVSATGAIVLFLGR